MFAIISIFCLIYFFTKNQINAVEVLVDGDFSTATSSSSLQTNDPGQDWYESRNDSAPNGPNQLTLDELDIGGNSTKKAKFTGGTSYNTYMSQALPQAITDGLITVEYDIYVDSIINQTYDRSGFLLIGNDADAANGPSSTDNDRYIMIVFDKTNGGDTGAVSLKYRDRDDLIGAFSTATSTLNLDTWYTIKVIADTSNDTFDLYVDDMQVVNDATTRKANISVTHVSFATWNDGAGTFYVDNVSFNDGTVVTLTQSNYRWYVNNQEHVDPDDPWPVGATDISENSNITSANSPADEDVLRLRMSILDSGSQLVTSTQAFKLQFGTGSDCSVVSNWEDVGAQDSESAWRGYDNASIIDNTTITSYLLTDTHTGGNYEEKPVSVVNPNAVYVGKMAEYDWVIQAHDTITDTNYCFRMVKDDGTPLDSYTRYPQITFESIPSLTLTQNNYRWYVNRDNIEPNDPWPVGVTDIAENTGIASTTAPVNDDVLRLRMSLQVGGSNLLTGSQKFKLQYGTGSTCSGVSNWQDVGDISSTTSAFRGYNNVSIADGETISSTILTGSDIYGTYEEENISANNPSEVSVDQDIEYDWVLHTNNTLLNTNYCFRMVKDDGTELGTYTRYPSITFESTIDVSFEGGNGENFVVNGNSISFDGERDIGTGDYRRTTWFYFSVNGVKGKTITFTMNNARGANTETNVWTGKRPFYSYDQINWYPATNDGTDNNPTFNWNAPGNSETFTQDTVYISYNPPYTYTDAQNDIARWELSDFASSTAVLGQSVQGRDIHLLTFEDTNSPIPYVNKKVMWVDARQHPMETPANYALQGLVDFYLDTTNPESKVFRQGWILKVIPDVNPDGMYLGQTRSNANGWDLNREWNNGAPNIGTEEVEVYNVHSAIHDWVTTQGNAIDIFFDMHTQSSLPPSAFYSDTSFSHEIMEDNLGFLLNYPFNAFTSGSYAIDVVTTQYGAPAYTIEGPDVRWDADNHPTVTNARGWGRAWAMSAVSEFETNAKVFTFHEISEGSGSSDKLLITAPGKFRAVFEEARGGAMTYWYDIENQPDHTAQLGDITNGIDRIVFNDGTTRNLSESTNVATSSIYLAGPVVNQITYTGTFAGVVNYNYVLTKTIWSDGRIWNQFSLTNNTGSSIDWSDMSIYNSLTNTNFDLLYDNSDTSPTPGTDNWWAQVGNGIGTPGNAIRAALVSYFLSQTGGWVYDTYSSASGPPKYNYYRDADGPTQANGETINVNWVTQISPDIDVLTNEAAIDRYSDDISNPDTPTMTTGSFIEFSPAGGLKFSASSNKAVFTYTNANTHTKKKPGFILTNYTASTAPVLKVGGNFLDSETGTAHSGDTYLGTQYISYVDDSNNTAYVQYLDDISANIEIQIGATLDVTTYTFTYSAGANGTLTGSSTQVINYGESGTEVTAVPNTGYHFTSWSDGVLTASRTDTNASSTITVTANFAIDAPSDSTPPTITILGSNPTSIFLGESYTDSGATATDNIDGDITSSIVVTNNLDINTIGSYIYTYVVSDTAGNISTSIRAVNVINRPSGGTIIIPPSNPVINNNNQEVNNNENRITTQISGTGSQSGGLFVKTNNISTLYFLDDNNIRHIYPSEAIWYSYFGKDFSVVSTLDNNQNMSDYKLGKNVVFKKGTLMKIPSVPRVYLVSDNGIIHWIKTEVKAIELYGVNWKYLVYDLNEAFFGDYTEGSIIE